VDGGEEWRGVSPLITPVEDFYVTDVNMRPPVVDVDAWRLSVTGTVGESLTLSYDDLLDLPLVEFDATMVCIHNRLGWDRLGTARWTGVPLARLLAAAGPDPASAVLVTRAVDGWECSIALRTLEQMSAYVVVGMAGRPLTAAHGFPARVFVPGVYGQYTGAKWLSELRLQTLPNRDYWLPRGWPRGPVLVRPLSRIDTPADRGRVSAGPTDVLGVAWAPRAVCPRSRSPWATSRGRTPSSPTNWPQRRGGGGGSGSRSRWTWAARRPWLWLDPVIADLGAYLYGLRSSHAGDGRTAHQGSGRRVRRPSGLVGRPAPGQTQGRAHPLASRARGPDRLARRPPNRRPSTTLSCPQAQRQAAGRSPRRQREVVS